jgi:hypothetical protein
MNHRGLVLLRLLHPFLLFHRHRLCLSRRLDKPPETADRGENQVAYHRLDATLWLSRKIEVSEERR